MKAGNKPLFDKLDRSLRDCFFEEWKAGNIKEWKRDYFRPASDLMLKTLGPFMGKGFYNLALMTRFSAKTESGWNAERVSEIMQVGTVNVVDSDPPKISAYCAPEMDASSPAHLPCPACRGLGIRKDGAAGGPTLPPEVLAIHDPMAQALGTKEFQELRSHRAKVISGELTGMSEPGIFQILFKGCFQGFGADPLDSVALIHYPAVWNFPAYVGQDEVDGFGLDPAVAAGAPWRRRCEECRGAGGILSRRGEMRIEREADGRG